jgi:hypothetical protein
MSKLTYCFSNSQPDRGRWRVKIFDLMMVVTKCVVHGKVVSHVQVIWVYIEYAYGMYWAGQSGKHLHLESEAHSRSTQTN